MEGVFRSGSFLYVQQSLLSDLNSREGAYLQVREDLTAAAVWE